MQITEHKQSPKTQNTNRICLGSAQSVLCVLFGLCALGFMLLPLSASASARLQMPPNYLSMGSGLVGYWTFDGKDTNWGTNTTNDLSGNSNTGTMTNMSTTTSPTPGKLGQALYFDNVDDHIVVGDVNAIDSATSLTGCAWVKHDTITDDDEIIQKYGGSDDGFIFFRDDTGVARNDIYSIYVGNSTDTSNARLESASNSSVVGKFTHVCFTLVAGSATGLRLYINGVEDANSPGNASSIVAIDSGTADLIIGATPAAALSHSGPIDDVRIYNRALTAAEVLNLYNSGVGKFNKTSSVNPIFTSGLIAHWTFDGKDTNWGTNTTNDISGQANTGTMLSMSTTTAPVPGVLGQGFLFDGQNDCVDGGSAAVLDNVPTVTFAYWAYFKTTSASDQAFLGKDAGGTNNGDVQVRVRNSGDATNPNKLQILTQTAPSTEDIITSNSAITVNKWTHVVMIIGASGKSMYIDNVKQTATSANTEGMRNATPSFSIGAIRVPCVNFANIILDDVRIYNRALSAAEIQGLYDLGKAKFNVTSRANTSLTNGLVGYWTFDGKDTNWNTNKTNDLSGQGNTGTMTNMSTTTSPTPGKLGQGLLFDGSDDYILAGDIASIDSATALSGCAWVKHTTISDDDVIMQKYTGANGFRLFRDDVGVSRNDMYSIFIEDSADADNVRGESATNSSVAGTWTNVCFTFQAASATGLRIYINGSEDANSPFDVSSIGAIDAGTDVFAIGASSNGNSPFNGSIDDVRVYNRVLTAAEVLQIYNLGR